jgi:hypothetical protein
MLFGVFMVGATLSITVTVNEHGAEVLPEASVAVWVTVVVPTGNIEPLLNPWVRFTVKHSNSTMYG